MGQPSYPADDPDLHAFVDGQMDLQRRAAFIRALSADPDARMRAEGWKRQNEALNATFGAILFEPVPVRLMPTSLSKDRRSSRHPESKIPSGEDKGVLSQQVAAHRPVSRALAAGIAIAAFLAGILVTCGAGTLGIGPNPLAGRYAAEAAPPIGRNALALRASEAHETYATDLNRPVEISAADEGHLVKWIQHRLSMPIRIPDLRNQGWTLLGGRVLPGQLGPAAFLVYGDGVERLGLYVARTNAARTDGYAIYDDGPDRPCVAYWVAEPVGFALTSGRGGSWFSRNAAALYQSVRTQLHDTASAF